MRYDGQPMFSTIKGKLIFFVTLVMIACTMVNIYFTHRDVGDAMLLAQEKSAQNILRSLDLMIEGDYRSLLSEKRYMTLQNRRKLQDTAAIILSVFKGYCTAGGEKDTGTLPMALDWIKTAPFKNADYYIIDGASNVVASSNDMITTQYFKTLTDIKHRNIARVMHYDTLAEKGDFAAFDLKVNEAETRSVLAYFKPFAARKMTVAVSVDISHIQAMAEKKQQQIITSLTDYARALKIADTGFVYMFNENHTVLIPSQGPDAMDMSRTRNLLTGNSVHEDIRLAAASETPQFHFMSATGEAREKLIVYCYYFKPFKWYTSVIVPVNEINRPARLLVIRQSLIIVSMFMAGLVAIILVVSRIASPLNLLSSYAKKIPELDFTRPLPQTTPIDHLPAAHKDEVGDLANSFILMRRELSRNIMDLVTITASRQRIESELSIAREIQLGMVPKTFPGFPQYDQFDLYATLKPAKEIGGDLYDFFQRDEDHIAFTLGDVSDKGIPSALFMVVTRTLIRVMSDDCATPSQMMTNINNVLSADNPRSMFVTLVIGFLNIRTGEITYANGGHNPPVVMTKEGAAFIEGKKEPLIGALPDMTYSDITLTLSQGDSFFLYTDGVNEAMNPDEEQFSNQRLLAQLSADRDAAPEAAITMMLEKIRDHSKTAPQSDDIAMLMIKYGNREAR